MRTEALVGTMVALAFCRASLGAEGPVAHWKFDEAGGTSVADSAGNFPGVAHGSAAFMPGAGIAGGAISLTRQGSGHVVIGDVLPMGANAKFTIVAWVRFPAGFPVEQVILGRYTPSMHAGYLLAANAGGAGYGAPDLAWFFTARPPGAEPRSTTIVTDDQWHQIAVTREPGTLRIYVDGAPAEGAGASFPILPTPAPLVIGGLQTSGPTVGAVQGMLDDIQIYNAVLSEPDIQHLFDNPGATVAARCLPDLAHSAIAGAPGYGRPNGVLDNEDFFYFLAQFAAGNAPVADMTTGAVPGQPGYGVPDGVIDNDDFFYYLAIFAAGC